MSLSAFVARTWSDYGLEPTYPEVSAANFNRIETGIAAVTAEVLSLEAALPSTYQPISAELSALAGLSSTGYAKRTGAGAWSVVASIPQADVSGLTAALAGLQPLDSDLTAIAGLTTTTFGRSLLTVADAAAARTAIGAQVAGSYQASSSVLTSIASQSSGTGLLKLTAGVASLDSSVYALASAIPLASSTTPSALGTAAVGTGTTWARADHVHAMPTAAQVGALGLTAQAADSAKLGGQLPSYYATAASLGSYLPLAGGTMSGNLLGSTSYNIGADANWWGTGYFTTLYASNNIVWHAGNLTNLSQLTNGPGYITSSGAPVQSVFGRTGAVVAASGDYSAYYLGISAQAADSAKLGGQLPSYYATAASLGNYLPLSAGSGSPLTGRLHGTSMFMSIGAPPSIGMWAWPVVPASRTFIGLATEDGTGESDWTTTTGLVMWYGSSVMSGSSSVGLTAGGVGVLSATSSLITLGAALSGTSATFSAGVVASSFRLSGWTANASSLVMAAPSTYAAGIVVSGSGNQQTQTFAQVDINGALQRRSDIAANGADFGGLVYGGACDASTYTTPGFAGNWASTGHWGIVGDNTSTLRFRVLNGSNVDAGSFANIAANGASFSAAITGTTAAMGYAKIGTWAGGSGFAEFSNSAMFGGTSYGIIHGNDGSLYLNAAATRGMHFRSNNQGTDISSDIALISASDIMLYAPTTINKNLTVTKRTLTKSIAYYWEMDAAATGTTFANAPIINTSIVRIASGPSSTTCKLPEPLSASGMVVHIIAGNNYNFTVYAVSGRLFKKDGSYVNYDVGVTTTSSTWVCLSDLGWYQVS